jgi:hypothetical protein
VRSPRKLLFAFGAALGVLLALESFARLLAPYEAPPAGLPLLPHPTRGWTLGEARPVHGGAGSSYRVSDQGLRLPAREGQPGAPLLLTTGDSSIFGDRLRDGETLHDTMLLAMEQRGVDVRVGTLAVPGYSTLQTRVVLDEVGWDMRPDLLIVGNLWSDSNFDAFQDAPMLAASSTLRARVEHRLSRSAAFRLLRGGVNTALGRPKSWKVTWIRPGRTGVRRVPLNDYARALESILDQASARGVSVVFLSLANDVMLDHGFREEDPWAPYFRVQQAVAHARSLPLVDGLSLLQGRRMPRERLVPDGMHPSPIATAALAEGLVNAILHQGWPRRKILPRAAPPVEPPADPFETRRQRADPYSVQRRILGQDP